ncbi:CD3337/EF1877 family mobilome membrane protein [Bacillus toyonensis]
MKIRKWVLFLTLCFLLIPIHVWAEEKDEKVTPRHVESGGVKLESKVYDWNQYEPVTYIKDSWNPLSSANLDKALNQSANFFFSLTKMVASLVDTAIDKLYSLSLINDAADDIADVSEAVYDNLAETLGMMLIIVAVVQIFYYYSAERSGGKAGKTTMALLAVIAFGTIWFSNASHYIKSMNALSNEAQGLIMTAGTTLADEKVQKGQEFQGSLAILRNSYFNLVVKKSYLIMNYGTPDEKEITKDDKKDKHRINDLLEYNTSEAGYKKREEMVRNEATEIKNVYMSPSTVTAKVGIAFCSFLFSLILGIPLLILAFLNPGLQILVLIFSLILGISLLLSLLPYFAHSGWKNFEKIAGLFLTKAFIGLAILFIFVIVQLMERFIPSTTPDMYMLNVIATAASMFIAYKFRDKIIATATGGRITSVDGGAAKQIYEKGIKEPAAKATQWTKQIAAATVGGTTGAAVIRSTGTSNTTGNAAEKLQARSATRNTQTNQEAKTSQQEKKNGKTEAPQTSKLARLRKRAVNLPADLKDKMNTAKEMVKEDAPLHAKHKAATVKDKAIQAKENVVTMPKRVRDTIQKDRSQGQAERSERAGTRQQRREQLQSEIQKMNRKPTQTTQTPSITSERKTTVRTPQERQTTQIIKKPTEQPTDGVEQPARPRKPQQILPTVPNTNSQEQQQRMQKLQVHEQPRASIERDRTAMRERNKE